MLTSRGWWFLLSIIAVLALAMLMRPPNASVALVGLTLGLWFAWEWLLFAVRARILTRRLRLERKLRDERGPVATLWAGGTFEVHAALYLQGWLGLPYVAIADRLPFGAEPHAGEAAAEGAVHAGHPLELKYSLRCAAPGKIRFEGVTLQLADLHGLFYHRSFVPAVSRYRVLPALADAAGQSATVKRHSHLPPPGVHRLRRPGSGSELLDLRDYLPGDPPKTVAWKVSARRDRLITKEFESEVPVRCTLFVDTSNSVRLGPPGQNGLTGLVEIAATVAQAATGTRDLIGLCLFDEQTFHVIRPARSARHLVHVLNTLADAAGLAPTTGEADANTLLPLAFSFADEVYPDLIRGDLNRMPFWLPWLWPQPAYTVPRPTLDDRFIRLLPLLLLVYGLLSLALVALSLVVLGWWLMSLDIGPRRASVIMAVLGVALTLGLALLPPRLFFPAQRRLYRWRKHLSALLSVRNRLAPGGLGLLLEDDELLVHYLQRFLAEHHVPYPLRLYDDRGRFLLAAPRKVEVLAHALLGAVGKGHDNELFVLLADLLELTEHLEPLLRAIKVALGRHHRVLVVCPWPPGIPAPDERERQEPGPEHVEADSPLATVQQLTVRGFHRAFYQTRRTFARLGVPMICAHSGDPAKLILNRLERLRMLGRK